MIGPEDVRAAARVLDGVAHRTPVVRSRTLGERVVLKPENLQRVGAFKFRGAYNKIASLQRGADVVAYSSGNHAQAVALASRLLGARATILMPTDAPASKVDSRRQRSVLDAGVVLPGSSDRPVVSGTPLLGIHDMVNRRTAAGAPFNPGEAVTAEEALRAYTWGSAYASKAEHVKGSVQTGKLADFTVLSEDPTAVSPGRIAGLEVIATIVDGELRYSALG